MTASPFEASFHEIDAEDRVAKVAMPPAIPEWVKVFVAAHHVDTPFVKRRRDRHAEGNAQDGIGDARIAPGCRCLAQPGFASGPEMSDFWSKRKAAARAADVAEAETARAETADDAATSSELADLPEAEVLARLGLPDPDAVVSGDDVAAFLARAAPRAIRNRALRSLWRSNPVLAILDGLNDYDGDFTGEGLRDGVLETSYAIGKGLAAHVERLEEILSDQKVEKS